MYNAILSNIYIFQKDYSAYDLRRQVAMYLLEHRHVMFDELEMHLICDQISYRQYVTDILDSRLWGDDGRYFSFH